MCTPDLVYNDHKILLNFDVYMYTLYGIDKQVVHKNYTCWSYLYVHEEKHNFKSIISPTSHYILKTFKNIVMSYILYYNKNYTHPNF